MERTRFASIAQPLALIAALAASSALAGCSSSRNPTATGAAVLLVPVTNDLSLAKKGENFDIHRVDPAFTRAVANYAAELRRLEVLPETERAAATRRALLLLAEAIEQIPHAPPEAAVGLVADQLRADSARVAIGMQVDGTDIRSVAHALDTSSRTLEYLAKTTYEGDPLVLERAKGLEQAVRKVDGEPSLRYPNDDVVDALYRAGLVLTQMHSAVARDLVR